MSAAAKHPNDAFAELGLSEDATSRLRSRAQEWRPPYSPRTPKTRRDRAQQPPEGHRPWPHHLRPVPGGQSMTYRQPIMGVRAPACLPEPRGHRHKGVHRGSRGRNRPAVAALLHGCHASAWAAGTTRHSRKGTQRPWALSWRPVASESRWSQPRTRTPAGRRGRASRLGLRSAEDAIAGRGTSQ